MNKEREDSIIRYASMVVIYSTDMAYNYIKALEPIVSYQDKETRRIYSALSKRYKRFFHTASDLYKEDEGFIADYSSIIDDRIDPMIESFTKHVYGLLRKNNIDNSELIAKTEMARALTILAVLCVDSMREVIRQCKMNVDITSIFDMKESEKALNDLYRWVTRKITCTIDLNENGEVKEFLDKVSSNIMAYDKFLEAYREAANEE